MVVVVALGRLGGLDLPVLEKDAEDRLELHQGEGGTDAAVAAGAERDPAPRVGDVLVAGVEVTVGHEGVGVGEGLGEAVRDAERGADELALADGVAGQLHVGGGLAEHEDQRRVEAQGLLDRRLQPGDLAQGLVADVVAVGEQLVELGISVVRPPSGGAGASGAGAGQPEKNG